LLALPLGYCGYRWHIYTSEFDWKRIPIQLEVANESYGDRGQSCHLLVFKMSDTARTKLKDGGLSFLKRASATRDANFYWTKWETTPWKPPKDDNYPPPFCFEDELTVDLDSASSKRAMKELNTSLAESGNFVAKGNEYILVANPMTGSVIFGGHD
jgi:hypothetical protein